MRPIRGWPSSGARRSWWACGPSTCPPHRATTGPTIQGNVDLIEALGSELMIHFTIDDHRVRARVRPTRMRTPRRSPGRAWPASTRAPRWRSASASRSPSAPWACSSSTRRRNRPSGPNQPGGTPGAGATVTVIGEAIIDLCPTASRDVPGRPRREPVQRRGRPGPLGHPPTLMARLADTAFGRILRDHAQAEGIDLTPRRAPRSRPRWPWCPWTPRPGPATTSTSTAPRTGSDGPGDRPACRGTAVLHFGSLASWTPPGDARSSAWPSACVTAATCWSATTRTSGPDCWRPPPRAARGGARRRAGAPGQGEHGRRGVAVPGPVAQPGGAGLAAARRGRGRHHQLVRRRRGVHAQGWSVRRPASTWPWPTPWAPGTLHRRADRLLDQRGRPTPAGLARCLEG